MPTDPSPMGMLDRRQDRLEARLETVEGDTEEIGMLRTELSEFKDAVEKQLTQVHEAFNRNTQVMYQLGVSIVITGALGVIIALIQKGVIG